MNIKQKFKIYVVNPENGEHVSPKVWKKIAPNPTVADMIAIETYGYGLYVAKDPIKKDGKILCVDWSEARILAGEFKSAGKLYNDEGFRLPTRHEAIDLFDARFHGLDQALAIIGGIPLHRGSSTWMWTGEEDPDPVLHSLFAVVFNGYSGSLQNHTKQIANAVRPISTFMLF